MFVYSALLTYQDIPANECAIAISVILNNATGNILYFSSACSARYEQAKYKPIITKA
ncbi:MAG: hypothetical protein KAT65_15645 [Methanophagales archaeon]|nr:MAG: hypothetical protein C5S38_02055 [Methanophagales archaeon]MCK4733888.1 hypothetical protein [Methanophagales archaeon]